MERLRFWLLTKLIRFWWWSESFLENTPHPKQHKPIFFVGLSALAISLIVTAASFGANLLINSLLKPKIKPKPPRLGQEFQVTSSQFGAPIPCIGGARPEGSNYGGVEVGSNIFWMPRIDRTQTPSGTGGGGGKGRGGGSSNQNVQVNYKCNLAAGFSEGRLRLLRLKLNEDVVYNIVGSGGPGSSPAPTRW